MRMSVLLQTTALCLGLGFGAGSTTAQAADPAKALADIGKSVMSLGPNGEKPVSADTVKLSDDEIAKIRDARRAEALDAAGVNLAALLPRPDQSEAS